MVTVADVMQATPPMMGAMPAAAPQPVPTSMVAPDLRPTAAARASLFTEAPRPVSAVAPTPPMAESSRPSLFSTVTGAFRRRQHPGAAAEPAPVRAEAGMPDPRAEQPRVSVRQTAGDEVGLDIPAFLRRQSS